MDYGWVCRAAPHATVGRDATSRRGRIIAVAVGALAAIAPIRRTSSGPHDRKRPTHAVSPPLTSVGRPLGRLAEATGRRQDLAVEQSSLVDPIEALTRDGLFVFDGHTLEIFAMDGSQRFHRRYLPELWVDGEFVYVRRQDHTTLPWIFDAGQRDDVEKLVAAVGAASPTM